MKVVITNLKAPWPAGARVGDVVDVGDSLPGCLVGKCRPAAPDAEAAHVYAPVLPRPVLAETSSSATEKQASAALRAELDEARAALLAVVAELDAARGELSARDRQVLDLQAKLAEAEAALLASKQAAPAPKGGKG